MSTTLVFSMDEVDVSPASVYVVEVSPNSYEVEVSLATTTVEISATGLQGPPGPQGLPGVGTTEWISERPAGSTDAVNEVFTTTYDYISGSIRVFLNGMRQYLDSYIETGTNQLDLTFAPYPGDELIVDYIKAP